MNTATIPAVRRSVTVATTQEHAFRVFTESFQTWWPRDYHIGTADPAEFVMEPTTGGRWYEKGVDGSQCDWGRVVTWEPPGLLVLAWQIDGHWAYDPDPSHASEIEVRFTAEGPGQTRVDLEHRLIERVGDTAQALAEGVGAPTGWTGLLEKFAAAATTG